jgi:glycosyltransferase involved in cell wall biosynthesis
MYEPQQYMHEMDFFRHKDRHTMVNTPVNVSVLASTVWGGGAEQVLFHMLSGLDRRRFHPRLVCFGPPGVISRELESEGIPAVYNLSRGKFDPLVGFRLAKTIGRGTDVLYCLDHHNVLFWVPYVMRWARPKAAVVICHSIKNAEGGASFRRLDRLGLRRMQKIVAVSEGQKRYLVEVERFPAERIRVIYNGVPSSVFVDPSLQRADRVAVRRELDIGSEQPVAAIIAHMRPEKNHRRFLRMAATVAARLPSACFIVTGDGPQRPALEDYARCLGVADHVRFVGVRRDVSRLLAAADVVTLTSDDRVETFPMALLEAMAARRPVVATRVGSLDEMVIEGMNGHLIPPEDEDALADAVHRVLADPARAAAMGEAGRQLVLDRFTAERMVSAHEALFEELLREASRRNGTAPQAP